MTKGHREDLDKAKRGKADEFYTQYADIEKEMSDHLGQFKGKRVLCNCDDPRESNFFRYFAANFLTLGLKSLIATCQGHQQGRTKGKGPKRQGGKDPLKGDRALAIEINEVGGGLGPFAKDPSALLGRLLKNRRNSVRELSGDGDFRSEECASILESCDIVATNPPFSLFREFLRQLVAHDKKFLIIGNINAATYKDVFPLIMGDKLWMGHSIHGGDREFRVPSSYPLDAAGHRVDPSGARFIRVKGVRWFTNLDVPHRHKPLRLTERYSPEAYPGYDNYDAIEVSAVSRIPCDYFGTMCVPITFLDKYNPSQFRILGITDRQNTSGLRTRKYTASDSPKYNDLNARGVILTDQGYKPKYARLLIRRRDPDD
ncbi:MAG: adenine-specific methyltransferase EcoRI family protein [Deltaproteobacteria bacterium]|jgi:hypothetical protein|nr:adenine-specific methyltransferase EcoRI family protein [Deltaproteobacteria bacterium]